MRTVLRFWLFLPCKKSASIAFWYQNAACRENPDPNAACGRKINGWTTAQVRKHISVQPFAPWRGARRADVCGFTGRPRIRAGLRHANAASALRGGMKKIRIKNFDWVILFGHSKTNFDSQNGRKEVK